MQAGDYWSGTEYAPYPGYAWYCYFPNGGQTYGVKGNVSYAWAVRPGARSTSAPTTSVPASGPMGLIIMGAAGLIIVGMRLRKATR